MRPQRSCSRRESSRARDRGPRLPLGLGDEARDRARDARRRRGRCGRPRRGGRAGRVDRPAPARPRERSAFPRRPADRTGRPPADLLEPGLRGARRARVGARRDAVRALPRRGRLPAARDGRRSCAGRPARTSTGRWRTQPRFARELLAPTLVAAETLAEATSVAFPGLAGVLPDYGRFDPIDWGLGFELKDDKAGPLDRDADVAAHVRPLRRLGHVPLGRSGPRARAASCSPTASSTSGRRRPGRRSPTPSSAKEVEQQPVELVRPLEARQVACALDCLQRGGGDLGGEPFGHRP